MIQFTHKPDPNDWSQKERPFDDILFDGTFIGVWSETLKEMVKLATIRHLCMKAPGEHATPATAS